MINLLPPETKQSYRYASYNAAILRWVIASALCLVLISAIGSYGWLSVRHATASAAKQINTTQASLSKAHLAETNRKVVEISSSFKLVQKVLSQEILFSKLLKQMATALPPGTYLSALNISQIASGSGLDVSVNAVSYSAATQVQVNLANPKNQIFAKADIQNISCDNANTTDAKTYPCTITLRAQFAQNNQFLFINQKQAVTKP